MKIPENLMNRCFHNFRWGAQNSPPGHKIRFRTAKDSKFFNNISLIIKVSKTFKNRSQYIDFKAVWPLNGHADSVGDK